MGEAPCLISAGKTPTGSASNRCHSSSCACCGEKAIKHSTSATSTRCAETAAALKTQHKPGYTRANYIAGLSSNGCADRGCSPEKHTNEGSRKPTNYKLISHKKKGTRPTSTPCSSSIGLMLLSNNVGFSRRPSDDITASAPVSSSNRSASAPVSTPPLATTGIDTAPFTLPMMSQLAAPWVVFFDKTVRP